MVNVARPIGELDLHLFGEGTHRRLWELLGPQPLHVDAAGAVSGVRFAVWAPTAIAVAVVGDWSHWAPTALRPIETDVPTGIWSATVPSARSGHRYAFEITAADGVVHRQADPMARRTERPPSGTSVVPDAADHAWSDDEWMASRAAVVAATAPMRVYDVHLGSWRRGVDTWDELAAELVAHVRLLGFTHVELMPIVEPRFGGSWGYPVSGCFAPASRFGEPDGFRRFVDVFHRNGLGVIVDWSPMRPDPRCGEYPEWANYVPDQGRNQVRNFLVANALYWLDEFHVDALCVDTAAPMLHLDDARGPGQWTPNADGGREHDETVRFLRELTAVVGEEFPDALVIAEGSSAWPGATRRVDQGGLGFSHTWNLGWMHDTLEYLAVEPGDRREHHHRMTLPVRSAHDERFVLPLGHDEVVSGTVSLLSKMGGDEPQRFAALRMLFAWQWALPGAPLVFMGSELAPREELTEQDTLPWHLLDQPPHRGVRDLVARLNDVADSWPALWSRDPDPGGFQWLDVDDADHAMFAFVRWDLDGVAAVVCLANFSDAARGDYRVGLPWAGRWDVVLDTDAAAWNGRGIRRDSVVVGTDDPWQGCSSSARLDVGPMSMVLLAARSPG